MVLPQTSRCNQTLHALGLPAEVQLPARPSALSAWRAARHLLVSLPCCFESFTLTPQVHYLIVTGCRLSISGPAVLIASYIAIRWLHFLCAACWALSRGQDRSESHAGQSSRPRGRPPGSHARGRGRAYSVSGRSGRTAGRGSGLSGRPSQGTALAVSDGNLDGEDPIANGAGEATVCAAPNGQSSKSEQ